MKRYTIYILFILIISVFVAGCSDKPAEIKNNVSDTKEATTPITTITTATVTYQDADWGNAFRKHVNFIQADLNSISMAEQYNDNDNIITAGENFENDSRSALEDNNKFSVSPKYQDAQNELNLTFQDYIKAGQAVIRRGTDGKANKNTQSDIAEEQKYLLSGTSHMNRAAAYLNTTTSP